MVGRPSPSKRIAMYGSSSKRMKSYSAARARRRARFSAERV
jgi:hypothetical protein